MRKVVQYWRSLSYRVIMYLDDGLAGAEDFDQASTLSEVIKRDLTELGFIIAESKSVWFPQQNIVWLGFEWDMSNGILKVNQERVRKLMFKVCVLFRAKIYMHA